MQLRFCWFGLIWIKNYFDSDQLDHRWGYDPAEQVDSDQLFPAFSYQRMLIDGARCGRFTCPKSTPRCLVLALSSRCLLVLAPRCLVLAQRCLVRRSLRRVALPRVLAPRSVLLVRLPTCGRRRRRGLSSTYCMAPIRSRDTTNPLYQKKMQRTKAMEAISTNLSTNFGFSITAAQADNKWKALLKDFRQVEDANNRSGAAPMEPPGESFGLEVHQMMEEIVGEKASSRPALLVGSGLPQASPRSAAARPVSVRKAEVSLAGLSLAKNSEAAWRAESPSMAMSGQERFKPPPWSKASSTSTPSRSASASSVSTPVSDDELELERDFGLLPNKDATEGATSTQVESMKRRSPPFSQPESKRKRRRPVKSASNEMLSWAGEYGQQQQKIQENFQEQLKEQHQEKMKAMQDLVNILARAVDKWLVNPAAVVSLSFILAPVTLMA